MTTPLASTSQASQPGEDQVSVAESLKALDERTRAIAEVADALRPLAELARQAPAMTAVLMDSFDEVMQTAIKNGIDVERGLLNGAEAALRFGAAMDPEKVRDLDALLKSGVLAPGPLRLIGDLARSLGDAASSPPAPLGLLGLVKALGRPDVQRAVGFLVAVAEGFGRRLRETPPPRS
ncbi:MAG: DUF1641 domain-containing protein [Vicinamibacterales bacterium]